MPSDPSHRSADPFRRPSDRLSPEDLNSGTRLPLWALLDNVRSVGNVGSAFRTADAAGLSGLYLTGMTATPPRADMEKTALGATECVPWDYWRNPADCVREIQGRGRIVVAVEQTDRAVELEAWNPEFPCCLVFGHEVSGVSEDVLALADAHVAIPMHGVKRSLNVAVSFGVAVFSLRRRWEMAPPTRR